jgi:hypothetical protein
MAGDLGLGYDICDLDSPEDVQAFAQAGLNSKGTDGNQHDDH